jgi:PIN domain nuclease of toxin-antitoxin system
LPRHHRDPFDRLLVAQAQLENLALVTSDVELRAYDVEILW